MKMPWKRKKKPTSVVIHASWKIVDRATEPPGEALRLKGDYIRATWAQ